MAYSSSNGGFYAAGHGQAPPPFIRELTCFSRRKPDGFLTFIRHSEPEARPYYGAPGS
jgi:hypothetical protein